MRLNYYANLLYLQSGSGLGVTSLIAEFIGGELACILRLHVPEIKFANLDEAFGRTKADEQIQALLKASVGLNLDLHYISGDVSFDPVVIFLRDVVE